MGNDDIFSQFGSTRDVLHNFSVIIRYILMSFATKNHRRLFIFETWSDRETTLFSIKLGHKDI